MNNNTTIYYDVKLYNIYKLYLNGISENNNEKLNFSDFLKRCNNNNFIY